MTDLRFRIYDSLDEAEASWRRIERDGHCYAFQSFDWVSTWYECVGSTQGYAPCPALIEDANEDSLMLLPLGIRRHRGLRTLAWLGDALADYLGPIVAHDPWAHDEFATVWRNIRSALPTHDLVLLERQPATIGSIANPFAALAGAPYSARAHAAHLGGSLEEFLASHRSSKSRATERRKERRLRDRGALEFVIADTSERRARFLPEMMMQKSRSYAELGVTDLFASLERRRFVETITARHPQMVRLFALTLNGETLATLWGLTYAKRFYHLLPTYARNEYTGYSPGNVLLRRVFEWSIDNGVDIYDFTVGDEDYKSHWSDEELSLTDSIRAASPWGWPAAFAQRATRRLKTTIKSSPRLFALARRLRKRGSPR